MKESKITVSKWELQRIFRAGIAFGLANGWDAYTGLKMCENDLFEFNIKQLFPKKYKRLFKEK